MVCNFIFFIKNLAKYCVYVKIYTNLCKIFFYDEESIY